MSNSFVEVPQQFSMSSFANLINESSPMEGFKTSTASVTEANDVLNNGILIETSKGCVKKR